MYRAILFTCLFYCVTAYNIYFYRGSFINKSVYNDFLKKLQTKLPDSTIQYQDYIRLQDFPENSILIGHSFGGFISLLHAISYPEHVKTCILINSHFNHINQMPYLRIPMNKVNQPTLCIFTDFDEKLPYEKVVQDWDIAIKEQMENKKFELYSGSHFSIFTKPASTKMVIDRIVRFINNR